MKIADGVMTGSSLALPFPHTNVTLGGNHYIIKFFAIFIILSGMSALLYGISVMTEYIKRGGILYSPFTYSLALR